MADAYPQANKPHAICVPFPAQGHVNPMMQFGKLLHHKGFHVTFVLTEYNRNRLINSGAATAVPAFPNFRFEAIPDGLPPSCDGNVTQSIPALCDSLNRTCLEPLRDLISKLNDTSYSGVPPVSCIISDGVLSFTFRAAEEFGIPEVVFWTMSACGFLGYAGYRQLRERGLVPLKVAGTATSGDASSAAAISTGFSSSLTMPAVAPSPLTVPPAISPSTVVDTASPTIPVISSYARTTAIGVHSPKVSVSHTPISTSVSTDISGPPSNSSPALMYSLPLVLLFSLPLLSLFKH
ncbi:hypothetical protein Nepgr_004853 [Nepenthes gracilis]|uniref:Uncharacterized protein n=1 Tax=Nepenthes gracilis TaxID=150966 RepID=A0AAD3XFM2_NEPGR|nr:hypothetical protein Nepgr_004853 [Nepenthes gracilis]